MLDHLFHMNHWFIGYVSWIIVYSHCEGPQNDELTMSLNNRNLWCTYLTSKTKTNLLIKPSLTFQALFCVICYINPLCVALFSCWQAWKAMCHHVEAMTASSHHDCQFALWFLDSYIMICSSCYNYTWPCKDGLHGFRSDHTLLGSSFWMVLFTMLLYCLPLW